MHGVRIVLWLLALPAVLVVAALLGLSWFGVAGPSTFGGSVTQHTYPTPTYWPVSPYSDPAPPAVPEISVAPCPRGQVPTTAPWHGKTVPACTVPGGVPADPNSGPKANPNTMIPSVAAISIP